MGTRCGFLARYSQSFLMPRSTPGPVGLPSDTSFSARYTLGTRKLYRFTGTLAAVATPRQLHGKSIALGPSRAGEPLLPLARYAVNAGQLPPFPSESAHAFKHNKRTFYMPREHPGAPLIGAVRCGEGSRRGARSGRAYGGMEATSSCRWAMQGHARICLAALDCSKSYMTGRKNEIASPRMAILSGECAIYSAGLAYNIVKLTWKTLPLWLRAS